MAQSEHDRRIDYIEFPAKEIAETKHFYSTVFGWEFTDYGPDYTSFEDGRLTGGFSTEAARENRAPLVVLYATDLEAIREDVLEAGGSLTKDIFSFPGGRRFEFSDPSGTQLAVWTDK